MAERIIEAPHLLFYRIETLKAMTLYPSLITDALATVRYPGTGKSIIEMNMLEDDIRINGNHVSFTLIFDRQNAYRQKSQKRRAARQTTGPEQRPHGVHFPGHVGKHQRETVRRSDHAVAETVVLQFALPPLRR